MQQNTHLAISAALCGRPLELATGRAVVELVTTPEMAADERGLTHGGFVFGLADYAAMLAINEPNVVLGSATRVEGKKQFVEVSVVRRSAPSSAPAETGQTQVFVGTFVCFVPKTHVLEARAGERA
jgi:acyl-coenzyme A thioesterase PaaI-like protein